MATQAKKNSSVVPVVIIGLVLVLTVGGIAYLYSTSKSPAPVNGNTRASNSNSPRTPNAPTNAPAGAAIGINSIGSPTATVTIEEFADFQCPTCATVHPAMKDVQAAFAGNKNVRFVFRHLPLSIHDKAFDAASVVEAAGIQGQPKFWAMVDQLMTNQQAWANNPNYKELWRGYAERIGLDVAKWQDDAAGLAAKGRIDLDIARARALGVTSTPSVYINNKPVPFSDVNVGTMRTLIDAEIAETAKSAAAANTSAAPASNNSGTAAANSNVKK